MMDGGWQDQLIYHIASGQAFFLGSALVLAGLGLSVAVKSSRLMPPFRNEVGRIQRRLAGEYGVTLIPKRIFLHVLMTPGATVDGVHLSAAGHRLMKEQVWELLESAYSGAAPE